MKYPNALKGIKRIFLSELLSLFAALTAIPVLFLTNNEENITEKEIDTTMVIIIILAAVLLLMRLIGYILNIIGIHKAAKDESVFGIALLFVILGIGSNIAADIFVNNKSVSAFLSGVHEISDILVTYYIIKGICSLSERLKNKKMVRRGKLLFGTYIILVVLIVAMNLVSRFFGNSVGDTIEGILAAATGVLTIIQYIIYLGYLLKARKMLSAK